MVRPTSAEKHYNQLLVKVAATTLLCFYSSKPEALACIIFYIYFQVKIFVSNDRIMSHWLRGRVVDQLAWSHLKLADQISPTCGLL